MTEVNGDQPKKIRYTPAIETHLLPCKCIEQTFKISVLLPAQTGPSAGKSSTVYAVDANDTFGALSEISRCLQSSGTTRAFILVGIGYPSDHPLAGLLLRARDLTFPGYPILSTEPPPIDGVLSAPEGTAQYFGADDFQKFLATELFPFIEQTYESDSTDRIYFGHSVGGGFGLYTLFEKSDLFGRYVISSPGLSYDGVSSAGVRYDRYEFMADVLDKFLLSGKQLSGKSLYMAVGTEEEYEPNYLNWRLTSSFYRFASQIKTASIDGLHFKAEALSGERHLTAWPIAFIRGMRTVFCAPTLAGCSE